MENWKTRKIILFITLCVCLNVCGKLISVHFELPLWADSFGTVLCAYIAGPVCGAIVGLTGNLAYCVVSHLSAAYSLTSIALGIIVGIASKRKWFDHFYGFMKAATMVVFTALIVSVPLDLLFNNGCTGNKWGDGVHGYMLDKGVSPFFSCIIGQLAVEFVDKVLTIAAVYLVFLIRRARGSYISGENGKKDGAAKAALILIITLGLYLYMPAEASESSSEDGTVCLTRC